MSKSGANLVYSVLSSVPCWLLPIRLLGPPAISRLHSVLNSSMLASVMLLTSSSPASALSLFPRILILPVFHLLLASSLESTSLLPRGQSTVPPPFTLSGSKFSSDLGTDVSSPNLFLYLLLSKSEQCLFCYSFITGKTHFVPFGMCSMNLLPSV